jgi:two-component system, chemotaxis family, protein-glutamate methylesterase/glutaminase
MERFLVMVGASAGGLEATCTLLKGLPAECNLTFVLVQHRSRDSVALCEVLQDCSDLPIEEVMDKAPVERGRVYLAPPDYHLLLEPGYFSLSVDAPELFSRPSIDVAFETAAEAYGPEVVGIVLTGANHDGSKGLRKIVDRGGYAIVQDPATAEVPVMPAAALRAVPAAEVLRLEDIPRRLFTLQSPTPTPGGRS